MKELVQKFRFRKIILAIADAFIVVVAALISNFVLSLWNHGVSQHIMVISITVSVFCCIMSLFMFGAYNKMWRYFSWKDYLSCVYGIVVGMAASCIFVYVIRGHIPMLYPILHCIITILGVCLFRMLFKQTFIELVECGRSDAKNKRTMIVGGGRATGLLLGEIKHAHTSPNQNDAPYKPVCIIDDDPNKIGTKLRGVPVVGNTSEIQKYAKQMKIEQIIFSIPSCLKDERKRILDACSKTDLPIKVMPFLSDLIFENDTNQSTLLKQIHDINVEDLLGRDPIRFDNQDIKNFISGKICMVTGGGGASALSWCGRSHGMHRSRSLSWISMKITPTTSSRNCGWSIRIP